MYPPLRSFPIFVVAIIVITYTTLCDYRLKYQIVDLNVYYKCVLNFFLDVDLCFARRILRCNKYFIFQSRGVLGMQMSDGLNELGYPKWQLALCVFIVYVMLYLSLFKGVKSSGK